MAPNKDQNSNQNDPAYEMPPPDVLPVASKYEAMFEGMMRRFEQQDDEIKRKFEQQQDEIKALRSQLEKALSATVNRFTTVELAGAFLNDRLNALDDCLATTTGNVQNFNQKVDLVHRETHELEDALHTTTSKVENLEDDVVEIGGQLDAVKDDLAMMAETEAPDDLEKDIH
jgi:chromosome segregation ATPase